MIVAEVVIAEPLAIPALFGLALVFFLAALATYALVKIFDYTFGLLLDMMAGIIHGIPFVGGFAAGGLHAIKNYCRAQILGTAARFDAYGTRFWSGAETLSRWTYDEIAALSADTYHGVSTLVHHTIPALVHGGTAPIDHRLDKVNTRTTARERAEAQRRSRGIDAVHKDLTAEKLHAQRGIDAVTTKVYGRIAHVEGILEGEIVAGRRYAHRVLSQRLTLLEKLLGVGVIGGVIAHVLTRLFPYWQCSNVRRFLRGVCRSPFGALDWIFALAALVLTALNPRQIAHLGQDAFDEFDELFSRMADNPLPSDRVSDWQPTGRYAPRGS